MVSAWDLAYANAGNAGVTMRPLTSVDDADALLHVMVSTWGEHQALPREMIVALAECGNVPVGAFDERQMVGYVLGWVGFDAEDGLHLHSHMLAALPGRRHRGVGYALKLAQRAQCLDQDIHVVRWTFDPLIARNAWFNLGKLGAVGDRFHRDFYGRMEDALNAGERSDRLVVRWELDREPGSRPNVAREPAVAVPVDYLALRTADATEARSWRNRIADALEERLRQGLIVAGFDRPTSSYRFAPRDRIPA